jgi:hypothetical protein
MLPTMEELAFEQIPIVNLARLRSGWPADRCAVAEESEFKAHSPAKVIPGKVHQPAY